MAEPHDTYSHYLPVELMDRLERWVDGRGMPRSDAVTQAITLFLADSVHTLHMHQETGSSNDR